jgi:hypothetical protein
MSPFRVTGPGRSRRESFGGPLRRRSPIRRSPIRSSTPMPRQERPGNERSESKQSVSAMLSEEPQPAARYHGSGRPVDDGGSRYSQAPPEDSKARMDLREASKPRESAGDA